MVGGGMTGGDTTIIQGHMSAMEKHADTSEKYLRQITNFMTIHDSKCKRDEIDEEDNDSSNDDK